jgi:hypothetical protein
MPPWVCQSLSNPWESDLSQHANSGVLAHLIPSLQSHPPARVSSTRRGHTVCANTQLLCVRTRLIPPSLQLHTPPPSSCARVFNKMWVYGSSGMLVYTTPSCTLLTSPPALCLLGTTQAPLQALDDAPNPSSRHNVTLRPHTW